MTESEALHNLVERGIEAELSAARRRGLSGPWCHVCGHESNDLAPCACHFPREFGCVGLRNLCSGCRNAHDKVARFLAGMFKEKRVCVPRADARRSAKFRWMRNALEAIHEKHGDAEANRLRSALGQRACPFGDEPEEFRRNVLAAFSRARFWDFQKLAVELDAEERLHYLEKITMSPYWNHMKV